MASRKSLSELFRPVGPKLIQAGIPWTSGGVANITQAIDLSLPIRGIRLVLRGRLVIGGADMASVSPEGLLNLIQELVISGTNSRQQGNITLWDIDLPTLWAMQHLFAEKAAYFSISVGGAAETTVATPGTPFTPGATVALGAYLAVTQATYDFRIVIDIPFHPFKAHSFGNHALTVPGFLVRNEEWKDSLQILLRFGTQANGVAGCLGVGAGGSTFTFSQYGAGGGTPVVDLYSLPVIMGLTMKDSVYPGIISRVATPVAGVLQAAGNNVPLLNLQKQPTPRVFAKIGTGTLPPSFTTLSDVNVTAAGILLGGNRGVRNMLDIWTHKMQQPDVYCRQTIQGYFMMDFMESGNPDSAYPGQDIGDGATFQLIANVAGAVNGQGIFVQEQMLHQPTGSLYNF